MLLLVLVPLILHREEVLRASVSYKAAEGFDSSLLKGCGWSWEVRPPEITAFPERVPVAAAQGGGVMPWQKHGLPRF